MDILTLVKSGLGLVAVLGILVFLLILPSSKKRNKSKKIEKKPSKPRTSLPSLEALRIIIKNKDTNRRELKNALDDVIKYYGTIPKKLGIRNHPDFIIYEDIVFSLCRHPRVNSSIIVDFVTSLEKKNEDYKAPINDALTKGLNSRGI
jgi:hypothetical protein